MQALGNVISYRRCVTVNSRVLSESLKESLNLLCASNTSLSVRHRNCRGFSESLKQFLNLVCASNTSLSVRHRKWRGFSESLKQSPNPLRISGAGCYVRVGSGSNL